MNTNLYLVHAAGDCGNYTCGNTYDVFHVFYDDNLIASVQFDYQTDERPFTATLTLESVEGVYLVPGLCNDMHLLSCVTLTVMSNFTADHEFYCESFYDDEGLSKRVPLKVLAL